MKTIPAGLTTHYTGEVLTTAKLWKLTRKDAQVFGFTDHDAAITYSAVTYAPTSAFDASAISTKGELNVDNLEIVGLLDSAGITEADIEAGRWDGASFIVYEVNWANISDGANILRAGELGSVQRRKGQYVAEMRGLMAKLQNNIGRLVSPACDADLGDARCGVNVAGLTVTTSVTTATSNRLFTASGLAQAAGYFTGGKVTFTSGPNSGLAMEVKQHSTGGVLSMQLPMPYTVAVGNTFTVYPGCDKRHFVDADGVVTGDCSVKFSNVVNFRGFPAVPGQDKVLKVGGQ